MLTHALHTLANQTFKQSTPIVVNFCVVVRGDVVFTAYLVIWDIMLHVDIVTKKCAKVLNHA